MTRGRRNLSGCNGPSPSAQVIRKRLERAAGGLVMRERSCVRAPGNHIRMGRNPTLSDPRVRFASRLVVTRPSLYCSQSRLGSICQ
jgi:hypothetical protein